MVVHRLRIYKVPAVVKDDVDIIVENDDQYEEVESDGRYIPYL